MAKPGLEFNSNNTTRLVVTLHKFTVRNYNSLKSKQVVKPGTSEKWIDSEVQLLGK